MEERTPLNRIAFRLRVRPELIDEYRRHHAEVWPDIRAALERCGWHNYSLFLDRRRHVVRLLRDNRQSGRRGRRHAGRAGERALAGVDGTVLRRCRRSCRSADAGHRGGLPPPMSQDAEETDMTSEQRVADGIRDLSIELPSWAFGNSGTRFKVFPQQGVPRDPYEKIATPRRSTSTPVPRPAWPCTSRGIASTTTAAWPSTPRSWACASGRSTRTSSRTTTTCWARCATPAQRSAARRPTTCSSASTSWMPPVPGSQALVRRWHELPRTGRPRRPAGSARHRTGRGVRATRCRPAHAARVQALRALLLSMDVPDWGTAFAHCIALGDKAQVVLTPGITRPGRTSSSSSPCCCAPVVWGVRLQLPLLRRRRSDGRRGRSVPIVPDHVGGSAGRRARPRDRRRLHARPVPQHRAEDPRADPLGHERAGSDGQGAAHDAEELAGAQRDGDVLGAHAVFMDAFVTDVRPLLARLREDAELEPDPVAAYHRSGYQDRIAPSGPAVSRRDGERDRRTGTWRSAADRRRGARSPVEPAGRGPAQHQLRRRQHLGQGLTSSIPSPTAPSSCCG